MQGIIVIDKPAGITSHDVVNRVRKILKTKRVGHTGTLDPFATGVMVVLVGGATRLAQFLDKDEKEYEAVIQFGSETDTGDRTGMRKVECELRNDELEARVSSMDWAEVFAQFRGETLQVPPMYSAKKVEGKRLYEVARKGKEVERTAVPVTIRQLEVLSQEAFRTPQSTLCIRVGCSAGTYIRTLAEDIGRAVGLGAHLIELRRTRAGRFIIEEAVTLEDLADSEDPAALLLSIDVAVSHLPDVRLSADRAVKTLSGLSSRVERPDLQDEAVVRISDPAGSLVAIGTYDQEEKSVRPRIVLG